MKNKIVLTAALSVALFGFGGCSDKQSNNADRTSEREPTPPGNVRSSQNGFERQPSTDGDTAGARTGGPDTNQRGSGSSGTADRNGFSATSPGRDSYRNVDPRFAGSRQGGRGATPRTGEPAKQ